MKTAPERIWLGKPPDDKSWEWHGAWSPQPFSENVNSFAYVREDIADERVKQLREALSEIVNGSGVEFDDERIGYVVMQVDRGALEDAREALEGKLDE